MESVIKKEPLVSVIINTRNRCKILSRAIDSALGQTFIDFELIVVDGASEDDTRQVVEKYIQKDQRVKYIYIEENKNAAYCFNTGLKKALGKYISILDDDDEFFPTKLEKQVKLMEERGESVGIVYCWEEFWDDKKDCRIREGKETSKGQLYNQLLAGPCTGGGTLMFIRKSAIQKVGGFDDSIKFGSDYQLNLNISEYYEHDFVPEVLVRTHWNHLYVHLTTQKGGIIDYAAVIEYYEKILKDHQKGFERYPRARFYHYQSILSAASRSKKYQVWIRYLLKGLSEHVDFSHKMTFVGKAVKRLCASVFSR